MLIDKDFSGGPVVKTPSFHTAGDPDLIPAGETKILYVLFCGQKLKKKCSLNLLTWHLEILCYSC